MRSLIIVLCGLICLTACGGGTTGSSSTIVIAKEVRGRVLDSNRQPIAGAKVTAAATGDFGETNSQGEFSFTTELSDEPQTFLIESPDGREVTLSSVFPSPDGDFVLEIVYERTLRETFRGITLETELGGPCAGRFFTFYKLLKDTIERNLQQTGIFLAGFDQLIDLSVPANCSFRGSISQGDRPAAGIRWEVSAGGCDDSNTEEPANLEDSLSRRRIIASGETDSTGRFEAPFSFNPRPGECNWAFYVPKGQLPASIAVLAYSRLEIENY